MTNDLTFAGAAETPRTPVTTTRVQGMVEIPASDFGPDAPPGAGTVPAHADESRPQTTGARHSKKDTRLIADEKIAVQLRKFLQARETGYSARQACGHLGIPITWVTGPDSYLARFQRTGVSGIAKPAERPDLKVCGHELPTWFIPAARFFYLISNLRRECGSVPEAILRTVELPNVPKGWNHALRNRLAKYLARYSGGENSDQPDLKELIEFQQEECWTENIPERGKTSGIESVRDPLLMGASTNRDRETPQETRSMVPEGLSGRSIPAHSQELPMLPICPATLKEAILKRFNSKQEIVPRTIAKQISLPEAIVQRHRSPRASALDNLSAPGSQRRYYNAETGKREIMIAGDWFGGDDATPGIAVVVPCREINTPCSQKFGVLIGRFQWLAFHDCRTDKILASDHVIRPRGSYRAEDILAGMHTVVKVHGIPRQGFQYEGGSWNSKLIRQAISLLDVQHWRTYSPHQKAIESIFNRVWTRLAVQFPHADMGRYRNENEANCKLYENCKAGHQDPRKYFPTLDIVLQAFDQEIAWHNAKRIQSTEYGTWIPNELFALQTGSGRAAVPSRHGGTSGALASGAATELTMATPQGAPLRQFSEEISWIFTPFTVERKIQGAIVKCTVPMFEDFSVPFQFSAPWMPLHRGKKVRLHFNPREPKCIAKIILMEASGVTPAGHILGDAQLIGETAQHVRSILNWATDDQRAGYIARQKTAHFLSRHTRAIGPQGRIEYAASETRTGLGQVSKLEIDSRAGQAGRAEVPVRQGGGSTADESQPQTPSRSERAARLAQLESIAKQSRY